LEDVGIRKRRLEERFGGAGAESTTRRSRLGGEIKQEESLTFDPKSEIIISIERIAVLR
jgi:hypothetical protein